MVSERQSLIDHLVEPEWLLPLGNGGYASAAWSGVGARSYHGLLVAALPAPWGRTLLVSHVDAVFVSGDGERHELSTRIYEPDWVHPRGDRALLEFEAEPHPVWIFRAGSNLLRCSVEAEPRAENVVWLRHELLDGPGGRLELRPFLTSRSFHGGEGLVRGRLEGLEGMLVWRPLDGRPGAALGAHGFRVDAAPLVHERFRRELEARRGLPCVEDLESPLLLSVDLGEERRSASLRFSDLDGIEVERSVEERPERVVPLPLGPPADRLERLRRAALACVVRHPGSGRPGILAGYPWFDEWGRDAMIALPGVVLASRNPDLGAEILSAWAERLSEGMLPNRLGEDEADPGYHSADAALWFCVALERCFEIGLEPRTLESLLPAVEEILERYHEGTRHGIGVDPEDGLLRAGEPGSHLTWMDACLPEGPVTPRRGKAIELNALYHAALGFHAAASEASGRSRAADRSRGRAARLAAGFETAFWDEELGWYRDVVHGDDDRALRPNQILALGLPRAPVRPDRARRAMAAVRERLLTPRGLRTLDPRDPRYLGRYEGDAASRDRAYHQGTAWPWLLGSWIDALLAFSEDPEVARDHGLAVVEAMLWDLDRGGLGHLGEIFDGDAPQRGGGAVAQAWSAAELFRAATRLRHSFTQGISSPRGRRL